MSQSGKLMPNLDQKGTKTLNLTVLQRIDPFVEEILMTVAHVTLYEFKMEFNQWSRKDVEGPLFVVKRNNQPRFQFIVMNRRSTDNLVEDLLGDFEYDVQTPYLLYRNGAQEVNGIWFYNSQDCEAVAILFSRILNAFSKVPPKPKVSSTKSSEFEELEAVPTLDVIEGPLEPPRSTANSVSDVPESSFMNFFSVAMNIGNTPNVAIAGPPQPSSTAVPLSSSHTPNAIPSTVLFLPSAPSLLTSSTTVMPHIDAHESSSNSYHSSNLVKPSFFSTPSSSMMHPIPSAVPTAPPLLPSVTMQRPYGTPLLQPFPPPTPPPSLTPAPNVPIITKDKVRDALLRLVHVDTCVVEIAVISILCCEYNLRGWRS